MPPGDACRVADVRVPRLGGLGPAVAVPGLCPERTVPVRCGGVREPGVGRAVGVAPAVLPGFTLPGDVPGSARYFDRDVVLPPYGPATGWSRRSATGRWTWTPRRPAPASRRP